MNFFLPTVILVCLSTSVAADEAFDIAKLKSLSSEGQKQFSAGEFAAAAGSFSQLIEMLPEGPVWNQHRYTAHYYIACAYSRLQKVDDAVRNLGKSMELGMRDFQFIAQDKDLDAIRKSPGYILVIKKYRAVEERKLQDFDFELIALNGKKIAKKDFIGKVVVADLWGTWCPPCRMGIPHFVALQRKYGKDGLQIIGLNSERARSPKAAENTVRQFIKQNGINYPCAIATEDVLKTVPDLRGFPTTLFIGRDGRVRSKITGYHDLAKLESIIKPLLAEKAPAKKSKTGGESKAE